MRAIDQVRHHAPAKAVTYRLSHKLSDGSTVIIPKVAYLPLRMSPPLGMASGTYRIHYFAESGEQIRDANQTLVLNSAEEKGQTQLHRALGTGGSTSGSAHFANAGERAEPTSDSDVDLGAGAGSGADDDAEFRTELIEDDDELSPEEDDEDGATEVRDDTEEQAERALERRIKEQTQMFVLQMRQQELHNKFLLKSQYTKEIGENLQLNGVYRRDFAEMSRILTETHRDRRIELNKLAADMQRNNDRYMERVDDLLARNDQLVAALAEAHKTPPMPPPPPDYVSLGHSALAMLQNIWLGLSAQKAEMLKALSQPALPSGTAEPVKNAGPQVVSKVAPLSGAQVQVNATVPPAPEAQPANAKTGEILRSYLSTLSDVEAGRLFQKDPAALTKWLNHLNEALAQSPVTESLDQGQGK